MPSFIRLLSLSNVPPHAISSGVGIPLLGSDDHIDEEDRTHGHEQLHRPLLLQGNLLLWITSRS